MLAAGLLAAALVAACAQRVSGRPVRPISTGFPTTTAQLAAFLVKGTKSIKTAELSLSVTTAGRSITAFGQETIEDGKVKDVAFTETIPDFGALNLVIKDGKYYAQLPPAQRSSGKAWLLVRPGSSSNVVRTLYKYLRNSQSSASLDSGAAFARATTRLMFLGSPTLDGTATGHYALAVQVSRLPRAYPGKAALRSAGVTRIPAEIWVDGQGRPRLVTEQLTVGATAVYTEVRLRQFDAPVSITAPPRDQVSTD